MTLRIVDTEEREDPVQNVPFCEHGLLQFDAAGPPRKLIFLVGITLDDLHDSLRNLRIMSLFLHVMRGITQNLNDSKHTCWWPYPFLPTVH